jgi:hypothetical protein
MPQEAESPGQARHRDLRSLPFDVEHFRKRAERGIREEVQEVFTYIHDTGHWQGTSSVSGAGSDDMQTALIRRALPGIIQAFEIRSMLDLPCGDFNWMKWVELGVDTYVGADIVEALVRQNQEKYEAPGRSFRVLDLTSDTLPKMDLLFCRDCLVHLSFADIRRALGNVRGSGIKYILTTTFPDCPANLDIRTGDWRLLNLQLPPFHFPSPVALMNEGCTEGNGSFADKSLGLWRVADLPEAG